MMDPSSETKHSRVGKKILEIPKGVEIKIDENTVQVKGPKGELSRSFPAAVEILHQQESNSIRVVPREKSGKQGRLYQGLSRALLGNMVQGVAEGYKSFLDLHGVGYRADIKGRDLTMALGLSHTVQLKLPENVSAKVETIDEAGIKRPRIWLESNDKESLGQLSSRIRSFRPPEPYKGKGVRVNGERIREKAGKSGGKGGK